MTPAEAFISFLGMTLVQIAIGAGGAGGGGGGSGVRGSEAAKTRRSDLQQQY